MKGNNAKWAGDEIAKNASLVRKSPEVFYLS